MLNLCCEWLQGLARQTGEKGFSLIAYRDGDYRRFNLQARPLERDVDLDKVDAGSLKGVSIAIAMDLPIRYCPHCGSDLSEIMKNQSEAFDDFASSMAHPK